MVSVENYVLVADLAEVGDFDYLLFAVEYAGVLELADEGLVDLFGVFLYLLGELLLEQGRLGDDRYRRLLLDGFLELLLEVLHAEQSVHGLLLLVCEVF